MLRSLDDADILRKISIILIICLLTLSLSDEYCDGFLQNLLPPGGKFQYRPELLCIGKNNSLRYQVFYTENRADPKAEWRKVNSEFLEKNGDMVADIYFRNMVDIDRDKAYISSVGSCKGDSGGPVFVKSKTAC